jgi:dTMP kinase
MFITFEGSEGSGKTSQLKLLAAYLCAQSIPVLTTREPGGTAISEQIRSVIHNVNNTEMLPRTEILLFQAARAQLVEQVIRPHLDQGGVVLSDRYADSTLAYQGYGYRTDLNKLRILIEFATGGLVPDLTILLDVDVELGLRRRAQDGKLNRLDSLDVDFYRRVRKGYLEMAQEQPQRWVIIDAGQPFDQVQTAVRQVVLERLQLGG